MIAREGSIPIKNIGLIHAAALTSEAIMSNNTSPISYGIYRLCQ
jgi:hypothetical protein